MAGGRISEPSRERLTCAPMRSGLHSCAFVALALGASCGGQPLVGHDADAAAFYVGKWTFQSGTLTPACPKLMPPPFSLVGLSVTITEVDDHTIRVRAGSDKCTVTFSVDGNKASAKPGQFCELDTGALLGVQNVGVSSWTLTRPKEGKPLASFFSGAVVICAATGSGVLVPADEFVPDAGAD
jgi:hypothetical protein